MSQYCYSSKKAPPGAVDPNGLPCDCSCKKPTVDMLTAGYVVDGTQESLYHTKGKMFTPSIPKRVVPSGENRKTPFWGGDGGTDMATNSQPYKAALLKNQAKKNEEDMFIEPRF